MAFVNAFLITAGIIMGLIIAPWFISLVGALLEMLYDKFFD